MVQWREKRGAGLVGGQMSGGRVERDGLIPEEIKDSRKSSSSIYY